MPFFRDVSISSIGRPDAGITGPTVRSSDEPHHQGWTVKRFHYDDHDQLRRHKTDFIDAYNFGRGLKTLRVSHTMRIHLQNWTTAPEKLTRNSIPQMPT